MNPSNYNLAYSPLNYSPTFSPTTPDSPTTPKIYGDPGDPSETISTQEEYGAWETSSDSEETIRNPKKRTSPPQDLEDIDPESTSQTKRRKVESIKAPRSEEIKKLALPNLRSQIEKLFNEKIQLSLQSAYFLGSKRLSQQDFTNIQALCTSHSYFPTPEDEPKLIDQLEEELAQIKCIFERCLAKNVNTNNALGSDLGSPLEEASEESSEAASSEMSGLSSPDGAEATVPLPIRVALLEKEVSQIKSFIQSYPLSTVNSVPLLTDYTYNQAVFAMPTVPDYNFEYAASVIPTVNDPYNHAINTLLSPANYNVGYVNTTYNPEVLAAYEAAIASHLALNNYEGYYSAQNVQLNVDAQEFPENVDRL